MTDFQYKRAPITEAVVEIRYASTVSEIKQRKAFNNFKKYYSDSKSIPNHSIEVEVDSNGKTITRSKENWSTNQFSSNDMTQVIHVTPNSLVISQLAPYEGWGKFFERIARDWEIWREHAGFQDIQRIGMRYINRIDIPLDGPILKYEDYISVYPTLPTILDPCRFYAVNIRTDLADIKSILNLKSSLVESPLPEHLAIMLDMDISTVPEKPQSDDELYSYLNEARIAKNSIFEACITDKARELFDT